MATGAQVATRDPLDRRQRLHGHVLVATRPEPTTLTFQAASQGNDRLSTVPAPVARIHLDGDRRRVRRRAAGQRRSRPQGDLVVRPSEDDVPADLRLQGRRVRPARRFRRRGRTWRRAQTLLLHRDARLPRLRFERRRTAPIPCPLTARRQPARSRRRRRALAHGLRILFRLDEDVAHAEQAEVGRRRLVGRLRLTRARGDPGGGGRRPTARPRARRPAAAASILAASDSSAAAGPHR